MAVGNSVLLERIVVVARTLPHETIEVLCHGLDASQEFPSGPLLHRLLLLLPSTSARTEAKGLLQCWAASAPSVDSRQLAWALRSGAEMHRLHRAQQGLELVWTGPQPESSTFRRTDQALLEVVERAEERLTLVCYAAYELGHLRHALLAALDRGVLVTMVLESKKESSGKLSHDASASLGEDMRARIRLIGWPAEHRPKDKKGNTGLLHAKCAVADGRWLFVSSANLTAHAHNLNLELGVLISGQELSGQVERLLSALIASGELREEG